MSGILPPIGFWSYTSSDDEASNGRLSALRLLLAKELQLKVGRNDRVKIFQDVAAIPHGTDWLKQIMNALAESSFFIPIVTPAFLQSEMCCREVLHFREREIALGRDDLILPLHYVTTDRVDPARPGACHDPAVLELLRSRQWIDFRPLRTRQVDSESVLNLLDAFSESIADALHRIVVPSASIPLPRPAIQATPRGPQPGDFDKEGPDYPEMVLIPAGTYLRGVPEAESEREGTNDDNARPVRRVTIANPFWLGRYPVTRGEFAAFINNTGYKMPDKAWTFEPDAKGDWTYAERAGRGWRNPGYPQTDRDPVVCVSHADAMAYLDWLNDRTKGGYRLPSEAEWEYAARAGTETARFWGDSMEQAHRHANTADQSLKRHMGKAAAGRSFIKGDDGFVFTSPVGSFSPNDFKTHDMLGNVSEWCADRWHNSYAGAPDDGAAWTTAGHDVRRVLRGGSWNDNPRSIRAGIRVDGSSAFRRRFVGFRPARTSF